MTLSAEIASVNGEWEDRAWFPPGLRPASYLFGDRNRLDALSDTELVEMAAAARRQTSRAQARELAAIAELSRRRTADEADGDPGYRVLSAHESVVEEVATALTVTGNAAATLVHLADRLTTDLPATREALEAGRIDLPKARVICDLSDGLPCDVAGRVEASVLDGAPAQTTGQLRRRVKRAVQRLAPQAVAERERAAVEGRRLELWESPFGTADLTVRDLPIADAHAIRNKLTAVATAVRNDGDGRTLDQLRADLARELLHGAALPQAVRSLAQADAPPPPPPVVTADDGPAPGDDVVGALAAIAGRHLAAVADQARAAGHLDALPFMVGRAVRDLRDRLAGLRDTWCQSGDLEHGHPGYRPPAAMRREVEARHATCVFPTCNRRSSRCDLDHTVPHGRGITCACNLAPLCRRHHRTKQTPGWSLAQPWPGLLIWITPSGRWHITLPDRQ